MKIRVEKGGKIIVPEELRKAYGLEEGALVHFEDTGLGIRLFSGRELTDPKIIDGVYCVSGLGVSHMWDAVTYLVDGGDGNCILVDCGTPHGFEKICENIRKLGFDPSKISMILLTHCHYDHAGGAYLFKERFGTKIGIHPLEKDSLEKGDRLKTASYFYDQEFKGTTPDVLFQEGMAIDVGRLKLKALHLPGHTPGGTGFYGRISGQNVLFLGDVGGLVSEIWGSDRRTILKTVDRVSKMDIDLLCHGHLWVNGKILADILRRFQMLFEDWCLQPVFARYRTKPYYSL